MSSTQVFVFYLTLPLVWVPNSVKSYVKSPFYPWRLISNTDILLLISLEIFVPLEYMNDKIVKKSTWFDNKKKEKVLYRMTIIHDHNKRSLTINMSPTHFHMHRKLHFHRFTYIETFCHIFSSSEIHMHRNIFTDS
jgi:hypothetical protein